MKNPSVYCYLNTCIQCLFSIPELNYYFYNEMYLLEKKTKSDSLPSCESLKLLTKYYYNSKNNSKIPGSVYDVCHSFLQANEQHDCQEYLRKLLSKIQDELSSVEKFKVPDNTTFENVWEIYRYNNSSFIDSLFSGLLRSNVICNK